MIKGLTHDKDGVLQQIIKYRGKISTGYAPNEGPNKKNAPAAAGFFRILKEVTSTQRIGASQNPITIKDWVLNEEMQIKLEKILGNKMPRRIELISLFKTPQEMWESSLAMYSTSEGLMCKSHGEGESAKFLTFDADGNRQWIDRGFDGKIGCAYHECPDYQAKKCKPIGLMKCFPTIDLTPNPYRFETRSINTILGVESSLNQLWNLLCVAHAIKEREAKKKLKFDGFFGAKLYLIHRKIKSGGRDVFITDVMPTPDFIAIIMEPIKRGLRHKVEQAKIKATEESVSMLLDNAGQQLLESIPDDEPVPMDLEDQQNIATQFATNSDNSESSKSEKITDDAKKKAAEVLLNGDKKKKTK